jgi:hypothetical protein
MGVDLLKGLETLLFKGVYDIRSFLVENLELAFDDVRNESMLVAEFF